MNRAVTADQVLAWRPCYSPQKIAVLFAGRQTLTAQDVAHLRIPVRDKIWALLHEEFFTPTELRLLACALVRGTPLGDGRTVWDLLADPRSHKAIETAERYAIGEATDTELAAARADAQRAAADAQRAETRERRPPESAAWAARAAATYVTLERISAPATAFEATVAAAAYAPSIADQGGLNPAVERAIKAAGAWQLSEIRTLLRDRT